MAKLAPGVRRILLGKPWGSPVKVMGKVEGCRCRHIQQQKKCRATLKPTAVAGQNPLLKDVFASKPCASSKRSPGLLLPLAGDERRQGREEVKNKSAQRIC